MPASSFDAIVVGAGQAGPSLAARMDREGLKVALVERKRIGGTCVNVGCTPTKALVASARAAHVARRAAEFGVVIEGEPRVDMRRVQARMREIVDRSTASLTRWIEGMEGVTLFRGQARFVGPDKLSVDGELLRAEKIFLNVGARAKVPDLPGVGDLPYLTNSTILELDELPRHLIVVGGGYIGLEFAQVYRRFGSDVTVVEMGPRLMPREDEEIARTIQQVLEREGVRFRLSAECVSLARRGDDISTRVDCGRGEPEIVGSHLLLAVGRVPNTADLGLASAGIQVDGRGFIEVDDQLRTGVPGIWALGDCNGRGAFTHTSYNDYEIVAANLFDHDNRRVSDRFPCYALFTDPPLGRVGMTKQQARDSGRRVKVGRRSMRDVGRARERSETDGFIEILVDADTLQILGAAILGINGDEVVHTLLALMYARAPYTVISRQTPIHPTVAELLPTVLQNLEPLVPSPDSFLFGAP